MTPFRADLDAALDSAASTAPVLGDLLDGRLPANIEFVVARHFAEVCVFVDIKIPSRMRLCPRDAHVAKRYFAEIYVEEQGRFQPGRDHASVFGRFCGSLGISPERLEIELDIYSKRFFKLLIEEPSREALIRELAISYAWESTMQRVSSGLGAVLATSFAMADTRYFDAHLEADPSHADHAFATLETYAVSDRSRRQAIDAAVRAVSVESPWTD